MRQKGILLTFIVFAVLFLIVLIVSLSFSSLIDINKELSYSNIDESTSKNISNPYDLSYFIFGYKGFLSILTNNSLNFIIFSLFWVYLLPLFFSFFGLFLLIFIFTLIIHNIRRDYKYQFAKRVGKWGMYVTFFILLAFAFISIILFSFLEVEFKKIQALKDKFDNEFFDTFSAISLLRVLAKGYIFGINYENVGSILGDDFNYALLVVSLVFGTIFLPTVGIMFVVFSSIWIATFISSRNSSHSKFRMWLKNIRIDSKREFYSLILKNIWLWIVAASFIITIISPGLVHPYNDGFQITLTVISIIIVPLVFIPLIIGMSRVVKIRRFNYNLLMFLQIMILIFTVILLQLTIWILFKEEIQVHSSVSSLIPFATITSSVFAEFGFVKLQQR
ncbi:hypothetical protein SCORR_v1c03880 [Spiroplasma corruscae]|uniref:Motility-associated protein Scm1 n=1 Tax=Spiroplasma corruscae TaxID=216934 RepID=A0A222ENU3_9MOLU|nr:motility-associated protein Scm1 [Spiroplasma corruscae]ASP28162.1 hypothetical protein SCORR_v1c03880 [Spiroplasma corruscae]